MTWLTKVCINKAMVFPVVMYGCESWTIKKAELRRIDAFGLWCWRKLLRVLWATKRSNQSILKEINPEYSLEELMLKLKLQYFGHLMRRADSLEKTLMLGKIEDEMVGWQHQLSGHEFEKALGDGERQGRLVCFSPWGHKGSEKTEQLNNKLPNPRSLLYYHLHHIDTFVRKFPLALLIWMWHFPLQLEYLLLYLPLQC